MLQRSNPYIRQHTAPDANPPSIASSWVTHSIHIEGLDADGNAVVECLWRLRVTVRPDDSKNAAPWSYTIRYFVEVSSRGSNGELDWCPINAYLNHDQALASIERQARRLGVDID